MTWTESTYDFEASECLSCNKQLGTEDYCQQVFADRDELHIDVTCRNCDEPLRLIVRWQPTGFLGVNVLVVPQDDDWAADPR